MPRKAQVHTPATLKKLAAPEKGIRRVAVGGVAGLEMQISDSNARSWVLRGTLHGKRINRGMGSIDDLSLADAREEARQTRRAWREGRDPAQERKAAVQARKAEQQQLVMFGDYYAGAVKALTANLTSPKAAAQWTATIESYALPVLADIPMADISVTDVVTALEPIWSAKADTASKLRGRIQNIIDRAIAQEIRTAANPATRSLIAAVLGKQNAVQHNHPSVAWTDAPAFWADLSAKGATSHSALRFLTLTATRSNEVRGATWAEIDLDARVWKIPAERTKTRTTYRVPLTDAAIAQLPAIGKPSDVVFPNTKGSPMSDAAMGKVMKAITADYYLDADSNRPAVPHGLRATFRTWSQEQHIDREVAEACLAHITGDDAERAYKRSDMIEARRDVLAQWAEYLEAGA